MPTQNDAAQVTTKAAALPCATRIKALSIFAAKVASTKHASSRDVRVQPTPVFV